MVHATDGNSSIGRITTDGTVTNYTDPGISARSGIAAGPDGALWFTNYRRRSSIGRIATSGTVTNYPVRHRRADRHRGRVRWCLVVHELRRDAAGERRGLQLDRADHHHGDRHGLHRSQHLGPRPHNRRARWSVVVHQRRQSQLGRKLDRTDRGVDATRCADDRNRDTGDASASVTFTASSDGGSPVLHFDASCSSGNGGIAGSAQNTVSPIVVVTGLTNGKIYTCSVTATNAMGTAHPRTLRQPVRPGDCRPGGGVASGWFTCSPSGNRARASAIRVRCWRMGRPSAGVGTPAGSWGTARQRARRRPSG